MPDEITYSLKIGFGKSKLDYFVKEEILDGSFRLQKSEGPKKIWKDFYNGRMVLERDQKGSIKSHLPENLPVSFETIVPMFNLIFEKSHLNVEKHTSFLGIALFSPLFGSMYDYFSSIKIYSIDPHMSKQPSLITGKKELEPDGSNLAVVLKNLLSDRKKRETFLTIIKELLPFINKTTVTTLQDRSLLLLQHEENVDKPLPSILVSDGTINIIATIVALFFSEGTLIIIEEPERNIHPSLISQLVELFKDVTGRMGRQVIVTTHNPLFVRNVSVENLMLLSRNEKGYSSISIPADQKEVREFLKNQIGIDELFIQNLLGE